MTAELPPKLSTPPTSVCTAVKKVPRSAASPLPESLAKSGASSEFFRSNLKMVLLDDHVRSRREDQTGFGRKVDIFLAGCRGSRSSRPGARRRSDGRSLAAACQCADRRASGCSPADKSGIALALAFLGSAGGVGRYRVRLTFHRHHAQPQVEFCRRRKPPRRLHAANRQLNLGTFRNDHLASHNHIFGN